MHGDASVDGCLLAVDKTTILFPATVCRRFVHTISVKERVQKTDGYFVRKIESMKNEKHAASCLSTLTCYA